MEKTEGIRSLMLLLDTGACTYGRYVRQILIMDSEAAATKARLRHAERMAYRQLKQGKKRQVSRVSSEAE